MHVFVIIALPREDEDTPPQPTLYREVGDLPGAIISGQVRRAKETPGRPVWIPRLHSYLCYSLVH